MAIIGVKYLGQVFREIKQEYVECNQLFPEEVGRLFKTNVTAVSMENKYLQGVRKKQKVQG